jgi:hypothetical protein
MNAVAKIAGRTLFRSCGLMWPKSETCRLEPQAVNRFRCDTTPMMFYTSRTVDDVSYITQTFVDDVLYIA